MTDDSLFEDLRAIYEKGDKAALGRAILFAAMFRCPIPDWAVSAFKAGVESLECGDATSWDDVLGRPHPERKHQFSIRLNYWKYELWAAVGHLRKQDGMNLGKAIKDVAQRACVSEGTIRRLYYAVENDPHRRIDVTK